MLSLIFKLSGDVNPAMKLQVEDFFFELADLVKVGRLVEAQLRPSALQGDQRRQVDPEPDLHFLLVRVLGGLVRRRLRACPAADQPGRDLLHVRR